MVHVCPTLQELSKIRDDILYSGLTTQEIQVLIDLIYTEDVMPITLIIIIIYYIIYIYIYIYIIYIINYVIYMMCIYRVQMITNKLFENRIYNFQIQHLSHLSISLGIRRYCDEDSVDQFLTFQDHISGICKSTHCHLRNIGRFRNL